MWVPDFNKSNSYCWVLEKTIDTHYYYRHQHQCQWAPCRSTSEPEPSQPSPAAQSTQSTSDRPRLLQCVARNRSRSIGRSRRDVNDRSSRVARNRSRSIGRSRRDVNDRSRSIDCGRRDGAASARLYACARRPMRVDVMIDQLNYLRCYVNETGNEFQLDSKLAGWFGFGFGGCYMQGHMERRNGEWRFKSSRVALQLRKLAIGRAWCSVGVAQFC